MYKAASAKDLGTIFQLRNVINRKNIGKKPKKDVNAHEDYFQQVVESHVLAAAMEFFGMDDIENDPNAEIFPPTLWMLEKEERYAVLLSVCGSIVDEFTDIIRTFETSPEQGEKGKQHQILAYAKEVMSFVLLYTELVDAVREGDGLRVLRWWRFMLLILKLPAERITA